jgi:hypothetical protein
MGSRSQLVRDQKETFGVSVKSLGNVGAAPAVDPTQGETHTLVLTANATIAAPVSAAGLNLGDPLYIIAIQDATGGRTLAWNAAWRNAPTLSAGTSNQRASFEFRWDGVNWQYVGGSTAFA